MDTGYSAMRSDEPHSQRLCQVKSLSPHHRFCDRAVFAF